MTLIEDELVPNEWARFWVRKMSSFPWPAILEVIYISRRSVERQRRIIDTL